MGKRQVHFTARYAQTISCCGLNASCLYNLQVFMLEKYVVMGK